MTDPLRSSIVRVLSPSGTVGAGFLVSEQYVLTCAHVVAQALGIPDDGSELPAGEVQLDFPLVAPGQTVRARVVGWHPVRRAASGAPDGGEDIATLELVGNLPDGSQAARLMTADDLWGHGFRAFGFPAGYDQGVWASGVLRAAEASGWVQIEDLKTTGYTVAPGFSGTPVWDEQAEGVVGMVVVAERRTDVKAAFIIPAARLVEAWPALGPRAIPPCPYRGLFAFREQDAAFFFGREAFTAQLAEAVARKPLAAVLGPSGSGKSSVVFAGLVPGLRREGGWLIASFRPGDRPVQSLAAALIPLLEAQLSETDRLVEARKLAEALRAGDLTLRDVVARILAKEPAAQHMLLVADQFEELYTLCHDAGDRQRLLDQLLPPADLQGPLPNLHLVVTMRADFLGHALSYRTLADALQHADLKLGPMSRQELQDAIERPAEKLGVMVEDGLTERILEAVTEGPGDLPLLEFALTLLWTKQSSGKLTHAAYDTIGGVEQALANHAEQVYCSLDEDEQQRAHRILVGLVRPGEGTEDTRYLATRADVGEENWDVVTRLADQRLVVSGRDEASGRETVELVHETLIRAWSRLRQWMATDRAFRSWQERLRGAIDQWEASNRDEGALLRGIPLAQAEQWLQQRPADLGQAERAFIEASLALREQERAERDRERRARERLRRQVTQAAIGAAVISLSLALVAGLQWRNAEAQHRLADEQARLAFSRQLAAQALTHVDDHVDLALLLGLEANRMADPPTTEARGSLLYTLAANPHLTAFLREHRSPVGSVAFSPDGARMVSAAADGGVVLWDLASRKPLDQLRADEPGAVSSVAFSPDGSTLAVGGQRRVTLWDVSMGRLQLQPRPGPAGANSLAFSPDGGRLAAAAADGMVTVWDVAAGRGIGPPLTGQTSRAVGVALSLDGRWLAAGLRDNTVVLWNLASDAPTARSLPGHQQPVQSVAFSPNSTLLASASEDGSLILWDVVGGQRLERSFVGHTDQVRDVAFSRDGRTLASGGRDNKVILWDVPTGKMVGQPLVGHTNGVLSLAFSSDGRTLASGGGDGSLILWDVQRGRPFSGHTDAVANVAFSPDGTMLASSSEDRAIILWDVAGGQPIGTPLTGHEDGVLNVGFSPDGRMLASGSRDGGVRLWDLTLRPPLSRLLGTHQASVKAVTFSPDGATLASGSRDMKVMLWDVTLPSPTPRVPPLALPEQAFSLAFNRDGTMLAVGLRNSQVMLWDVSRTSPISPLLLGHSGPVQGVAFSPDGRTLLSGSGDGSLILWDVATGQMLGRPLTGHRHAVESVAFSPDGSTLASGSDDGTVILWDVASRRSLGEPLGGHANWVSSVAFSRDGSTLASGSKDGTVILWNVSFESWPARVCSIVGRNLSTAEWRQYLGDEPEGKTCPELP